MKLLLTHGLNLDSENSETLLNLYVQLERAICDGYVTVLEDFLNYGLDVNRKFISQINQTRKTLLHSAVEYDQKAVISLLLKFNASITIKDDSGQTALGRAIAMNSRECVEMLLEYSSDVNVKENRHLFWDLLRTPSVEKCELAGAFLRHGFVPEPSVSHASIKLFFAVTSQHIEPLTSLIQEGADVHSTFGGQSFLHLATACGHYDGVKALIAAGADVFARNADNRFAIYYASHLGGERLVQLFLDSGLKPSEHPELYHYPILAFTDLVISSKDCEKLTTQEKHYITMLDQLENQGADVNYCDDEGQNAMHLLLRLLQTRNEKLIMPEIIFEDDCRCISDERIKNGIALFYYLLRRVNLNAKTRRGLSPLHLAVVLHNMPSVVKKLLSQEGLYLDSRDVSGKSALHVACDYCVDQTIYLLLNYGADLNRPNATGHLLIDTHIDNKYEYKKLLFLFHQAGLQLQASNVEYLSQCNIRGTLFSLSCRIELEDLDDLCQLGTVRDLFAVPKHRLASLARHPDLLRLVQTKIGMLYKPILCRRLEQAVWRAGLLDEATQAFDAIVRSFGCSLPGYCIEAVFEYLADYELEGFFRATHANAQETAKLYQRLTENLLNAFKSNLPMDHLASDDNT